MRGDTMWKRMAQWLRQWRSGRPVRIEPHPPLSGDRDERRLEQARFEAETRHVGAPPEGPPATNAVPARLPPKSPPDGSG